MPASSTLMCLCVPAALDSLALFECIFEVEDRMGVAVPDDNPNMDTLAELAEAIDHVRAKSEPAVQQTA